MILSTFRSAPLKSQAARPGGTGRHTGRRTCLAFVEAHFAAEALRESAAAHAEWFNARPGWLEDAEVERYSA